MKRISLSLSKTSEMFQQLPVAFIRDFTTSHTTQRPHTPQTPLTQHITPHTTHHLSHYASPLTPHNTPHSTQPPSLHTTPPTPHNTPHTTLHNPPTPHNPPHTIPHITTSLAPHHTLYTHTLFSRPCISDITFCTALEEGSVGGARVPSDRLTPGALGYAYPPLTMGTAGGGRESTVKCVSIWTRGTQQGRQGCNI